MTPTEALAEAWASIDGELDAFRRERELDISIAEMIKDPTFTGHYLGYMEEAVEMIKRLRARGYAVVPLEPTPAMIEAMEQEIGEGIYTDGYESTGYYAAYDHKDPAAPYKAAIQAASVAAIEEKA